MRRVIAAGLLLVGCRWRFDATSTTDDARDGNGAELGSPIDAYIHTPFPIGMPVSELNLSGQQDDDPTLTADMLEIFFDSDRPATGAAAGDIWRASRTSTALPFDPPQPVTELLSTFDDTTPDLSPDGLTIYFGSDRASPGNRDLYVSTRPDRTTPWSSPTRIAELASSTDESGACQSGDGLTLFVSSDRIGGLNDIFESTRATTSDAWGPLTLVPGLSDPVRFETQFWCNAELTVVYFTIDSTATMGDIYVTSRASRSEPFGAAVRLDELASAVVDADPWLSPDLRTIYYYSAITGSGDIYVSTR